MCITEVDYFGGVYVAFDKPAKKRKKKRKKSNSPQLTLEDQYLSWDILRTTRKNTILRRLRQRDNSDEEETESEWEWDDGERGESGNGDEEQQDYDGDHALDEDGNVQYFWGHYEGRIKILTLNNLLHYQENSNLLFMIWLTRLSEVKDRLNNVWFRLNDVRFRLNDVQFRLNVLLSLKRSRNQTSFKRNEMT